MDLYHPCRTTLWSIEEVHVQPGIIGLDCIASSTEDTVARLGLVLSSRGHLRITYISPPYLLSAGSVTELRLDSIRDL